MKEELIGVVKGDIKDFMSKMNQVSSKLKDTSGLVDRYGNKIESANQSVTQSSAKASKAVTGMGMSFSKLGGYALAAFGVIKSGQIVINQSSAASDKLKEVVEGVSFGFQSLSSQILNLDFTNFFSNISKAIEMGSELEKRRDKLEDTTRALTIQESKYRDEIEALRLFASEETDETGRIKTREERANAIRQAIILQKELNKIREQTAKEAADIATNVLSEQTGIFDPQAVKQFWETFNKESIIILRSQAEEFIKQQKRFKENTVGFTDKEIESFLPTTQLGKMRDDLKNVNENVKIYAHLLTSMGGAPDEAINAVISSLTNLNAASKQGDRELRSLNRALNGLTDVEPIKTEIKPLTPIEGRVDIVGVKPESLKNLRIELAKTMTFMEDISDTVTNKVVVAFDQFGKKIGETRQVVIDIGKELSYLVTDALIALSEGLGEAFATGDFEQGAKKMLMAVADWAQKFGAILIAAGVASEAFQKSLSSNPYVAIAAGAALVAAASLAKAALDRRPGASSQNRPSGGGGDFDLAGFRNLRSDFVVQVNGTLTGNGRDLLAVIETEQTRKTF